MRRRNGENMAVTANWRMAWHGAQWYHQRSGEKSSISGGNVIVSNESGIINGVAVMKM